MQEKSLPNNAIKLTQLLEVDESCQSVNAISAVLGNRYLYSTNRLVWDGAPPVDEERAQMDKLVNFCFVISARFREETAHAYFRLYDCEREFIEIGRSDFLHDLVDSGLMDLLSALTNIALYRGQAAHVASASSL